MLDESIADVGHVLKAAGMDITVNKINITTRELAIQHRFISSPTIRINGQDIDADVRETKCESCGDLYGDSVDCRVWTYQDVEYTEPPKALIINVLLQSVYGSPKQQQQTEYTVPENLVRFFDAMQNKADK